MSQIDTSERDRWQPWIAQLWTFLDRIVADEEAPQTIVLANEAIRWGEALRRQERHAFPSMSGSERGAVIRLFVERMRLQNLAEDLGRVQLVQSRRGKESPERLRGSVDALQQRLVDSPPAATVTRLEGHLVLTVHPTESTRRTILQHVRRLSDLWARYSEAKGHEHQGLEYHIQEQLRALWRTAAQRANRPQVRDEVELGLFYLAESLFDALPEVEDAINRVLAEGSSAYLHWRIDSWIGGDRDGHPFVDAAVTSMTMTRHRQTALALYQKSLEDMEHILTGHRRFVEQSERLDRWMEEARRDFPEVSNDLSARYPDEPLRQMAGLIRARWEATRRGGGKGYANAQAFGQDVQLMGILWDSDRAHWPVELQRLLTQIATFGFHLATLDLRQHSRVHEEAMMELLGHDYRQWKEGDRITALATLLQEAPPPWLPMTNATRDLRDTLQEVARFRRQYGSDMVKRYLVSMAHAASDLLEVVSLMRAVDPELDLAVVPVIETLQDLESAEEMLNDLWRTPGWRSYLARHQDTQEIMLGYSDSTKDAGVWTASWAIYETQRRLVRWGQEHGVRIGFFHGRGGALGRGGGPTSLAILAQPPGTLSGTLRMTQQGEVLSQKFLLPQVAARSLELMMTAHATAALYPSQEPDAVVQEAMQAVSKEAVHTYRQLIDHDGFWEYFLAVTPIREMSALNWGSRPSWREQFQFEDLRAIPWVFSWTQNRMGIPAWFGAGTALSHLVHRQGLEGVQAMARNWPFFSTLLHNLELAVVKADLVAAREYQSLATEELREQFWPVIKSEHHRLATALRDISGEERLLATQPRIRRAVDWRNPQVDALNHMQVDLLRQYRDTGDDTLLPLLAQTMEGIALGVRNSG